MSPEERVLESWYDRLTAYSVDKSRVIVVEFQSWDPMLAAKITNAIASTYLRMEQNLRLDQARGANQWLAGEIDQLRLRVADAEAKAEAFRSRTNLLVGTNNTTLNNQQLGEINSQVAAARGQKADSETRAKIIREMLRRGETIELTDVVNSELIRRLSEQRGALRAQLAEQSTQLLDRHPRIMELKAQVGDLDKQIRAEADKLARSLENDARIASAKVDASSANLDMVKKQAATTGEQDVQLRALDREAKAQRDLLESYLARYRETTARETIGTAPADAKIISAAIASNTPYFPKKVPIVVGGDADHLHPVQRPRRDRGAAARILRGGRDPGRPRGPSRGSISPRGRGRRWRVPSTSSLPSWRRRSHRRCRRRRIPRPRASATSRNGCAPMLRSAAASR